MRGRRHFLRDVVILTVPAVVLLVYVVAATAVGFYNAEIKNFHGYLTRNVRITGPAGIARIALEPILSPPPAAYMPLKRPGPGAARRYDLRIDGHSLDRLGANLPRSGEEWQPANLVENGKFQRVEVRHRGQAFGNFFRRKKTWKIKTRRRNLIDGYRIINLTPVGQGRLPDHLSFYAARAMGLPASRTRVVHLYLNLKDQGLYLQEEQVDESMMRRCGRMPGDVFYGELSIPNEAKLGSNDLFWNPFLWTKKARNNRYPDGYRPYLTALLDRVSDPSTASYAPMYRLLDEEEYALYFGLLSYFGDQHTDRSHNHKLFFNPLTGRFEGLLWNAMNTMPDKVGLESVANELFLKLARDPRFLDRMHRLMSERFFGRDVPAKMSAEIDRVVETYAQEALDPEGFASYARGLQHSIARRNEHIEGRLAVAEATFACRKGGLLVRARSATSLRLTALELDAPADGVRLIEDRDFDGKVSPGDRELDVRADGKILSVVTPDALLYAGRDFRAPFFEPDQARGDTFQLYRMYTRLAFLETPFLLVGRGEEQAPGVVRIRAGRTLGEGSVTVRAAAEGDYVSRGAIHPWRFPRQREPRTHRFSGDVLLKETLIVEEQDRFEAARGTRLRLGPGVSILIRSRVNLDGIHVERANPEKPWGVFVLQGPAASKSRISRSSFRGGSHDTIGYVYYSGMVSVHYADDVVFSDCGFSDNLLGDDTLRFARCSRLRVAGCRVERANGDAIDCDISDGEIVDTHVIRPRNDGIDLMTANVNLRNTTVTGAGDKGFSFGESASPKVSGCRLIGCVMGIGLKDGSDPVLIDVEISGCRLGVSGYDKNWRYPGGGRGVLRNCVLTGNGRDIVLDPASTLRMERCVVDAGFKPPTDAVLEGRLQLVDMPPAEGSR